MSFSGLGGAPGDSEQGCKRIIAVLEGNGPAMCEFAHRSLGAERGEGSEYFVSHGNKQY